jgi:methylated-DNA-[protein]-cysteine S-methyltransferase
VTQEKKVYAAVIDTPLGKMQAAARNDALTGLWFVGQKYFPKDTEFWLKGQDHPPFVSLKKWLEAYFSGKKPKITIPLAPHGTEFQQAVWKLLLEIPYGKTTTYGAIAERLSSTGKKAAAQAVGGAVGHNPISLIIPCHRVLGADGSLTGYAGGLDKKRALLELEGAIPTGAPDKRLRQ